MNDHFLSPLPCIEGKGSFFERNSSYFVKISLKIEVVSNEIELI